MAKSVGIRIDEELYRQLHIRVAESGKSLQDYIAALIERDMHPERFCSLSLEQYKEIADLADKMLEIIEQGYEQDAPQMGGMTLG